MSIRRQLGIYCQLFVSIQRQNFGISSFWRLADFMFRKNSWMSSWVTTLPSSANFLRNVFRDSFISLYPLMASIWKSYTCIFENCSLRHLLYDYNFDFPTISLRFCNFSWKLYLSSFLKPLKMASSSCVLTTVWHRKKNSGMTQNKLIDSGLK